MLVMAQTGMKPVQIKESMRDELKIVAAKRKQFLKDLLEEAWEAYKKMMGKNLHHRAHKDAA